MTEYIPNSPAPVTGPYSADEREAITRYLADDMAPVEIAKRLNRRPESVRNYLWLRGLTNPHPWTDDEVALLRSYYAEREGKRLYLDRLCAQLGRSMPAVIRKACKLGITDTDRPRHDAPKPKVRLTAEELSEVKRAAIRAHGHSRGALGLRHTPEARQRMGEAARAYWDTVTKEQLEIRRMRANHTKIERYGTAGPSIALSETPYSRARGGFREDIGLYVRSAWEANYSRYLNWLVEQGEIQSWEYEADTFIFHGETRGAITYRPDFKVTERDGSVVYHEVKGWMDGPSKTRLKRMKKHYPDVAVLVIGEAEYKAVSKWRDLIPNWE